MAIESLNHYQVEALRTVGSSDLSILGLGVAGEAGEVADIIKKELGHGHVRDAEKMAKEIGDVLWYLAVLADEYGYSLAAIATMNISKLKARYPQGFSVEASINREDHTGDKQFNASMMAYYGRERILAEVAK